LNVDVVAKTGPKTKILTYRWPEHLGEPLIGQRVRVPLRSKLQEAWIVGVSSTEVSFVLREVKKVIGSGPPPNVVDLCLALSWIYKVSAGYFLQMASPDRVGKHSRRSLGDEPRTLRYLPGSGSDPLELIGDFSAPKTYWVPPNHTLLEVIRERVRSHLVRGPCLVLLPNRERVEEASKSLIDIDAPVHLLESDWHLIAGHRGSQVVLGTRSAVLAPLVSLSAVIVVDPLDRSMREQRSPFYETYDLALIRSALEGAEMETVTTLPPLVSLAHSKVLRPPMREMIKASARVMLWDMTESKSYLDVVSRALQITQKTKAQGSLEVDASLVVVYNKKGFILKIRCKSCKTVQTCEVCKSPLLGVTGGISSSMHKEDWLRLEKERATLKGQRCPSCKVTYPPICGVCHSLDLATYSKGTEKIARELSLALGRGTKIEELTSVSIPGSEDDQIDDGRKSIDVLVGTEATLLRSIKAEAVVFLDFDQFINPLEDGETYVLYLLTRALDMVSMAGGSVHLQGRYLETPLVQLARKGHVEEFVREIFNERKTFGLPPFSVVAKVDHRSGMELESWVEKSSSELPYKEIVFGEDDKGDILVSARTKVDLLRVLGLYEEESSTRLRRLELSPRGTGFL